ncbi:hypothetical protein [Dyadobacter frigoris]|uniref:Uncharacterized protein n=1 Tax=Dyadobacter frigoris TaxID=2576211 RepID=A0A4U6D5Y2_9BACT|nr:hypothetical protein [Dyadobacter frigoris]TKT89464.1 hypothetical protein FDK13_24285 [Dyadobacter frigoris]
MAKRTIAYLKAAFGLLKKPKDTDFGDVFDSYVHKDDLETVNNSAIDLRINTFNTALRAETPGAIDTLGDVLKAFTGFPDTGNLKAMIDAASGTGITWDKVTGRPASVPVIWDEQTATFNWNAVGTGILPGTFAPAVSMKAYLSLPAGVRALVTDISVIPYTFTVPGDTRVTNKLASVTFAVTPKISLT